ncbi:glycosyltransferase family 4 protein [Candidatus Woesearchaeota archaeon]|nr:glycosyltransferase family 4 protein [Candidatus Woesearchaeota archaeon]
MKQGNCTLVVRMGSELNPLSGIEGCGNGEMIFTEFLIHALSNKNKDFDFLLFSRPFSASTMEKFLPERNDKSSVALLESLLGDPLRYGALVKNRKKEAIARLKNSLLFIPYSAFERFLLAMIKKSFFRKPAQFCLSLCYYRKIAKQLRLWLIANKAKKLIIHFVNRPAALFFSGIKKIVPKVSFILELQNSHLAVKSHFGQRIIGRIASQYRSLVFLSRFVFEEYCKKSVDIEHASNHQSNHISKHKSGHASIIYNGLSIIHRNLADSPIKLLASLRNPHPFHQKKDGIAEPYNLILSSWKSSMYFPNKLPGGIEVSKTITLLFVGRIVPQKGLDVLLDALSIVMEDNFLMSALSSKKTALCLKVIGTPIVGRTVLSKYYKAIKQQLWALKSIGGKNILEIAHIPYCGRVELSKQYLQSDIVVCPSLWDEPWGFVVAEGMLFRNIVLASRAGGIPETIEDQKTGFLFPKGDALHLSSLLKQAISSILDDDRSIKELCRNAKKAVEEKFSIERRYEELMEIYRHC